MTVNQWIALGNLTAQPELRKNCNGTRYATFTIACNYRFKDRDGEDREEVLFMPCVAYGNWIDNIGTAVKGSLMFVQGRIVNNVWKDRKGAMRRQTECFVERVFVCRPPRNAPLVNDVPLVEPDAPAHHVTDTSDAEDGAFPFDRPPKRVPF